MPNSDQDDIISTTVRAMAQHVVILALVRTHPKPQELRDLVEQFAEATRANLLSTTWSDAQVQLFDRALDVILNTLPPPSAK
jgi:hypothetical protein